MDKTDPKPDQARQEARRHEVMARRREILSTFERERGSKAITLIHRREPWEDDEQFITIEDSEFVLMQIKHHASRRADRPDHAHAGRPGAGG